MSSSAIVSSATDSTPAVSSSTRITLVVDGVPSATPAGNVAPNPSNTLSPSSSTASSVAITVNVVDASPREPNVTLTGTPDQSASASP